MSELRAEGVGVLLKTSPNMLVFTCKTNTIRRELEVTLLQQIEWMFTLDYTKTYAQYSALFNTTYVIYGRRYTNRR